jgi:hypothetical protein
MTRWSPFIATQLSKFEGEESSLFCNFEQRFSTCFPFTATVIAFFCPTKRTNCLPRVMPV